MARMRWRDSCAGCFWQDNCINEQPCEFYTQNDIENELAERADRRRRAQFYADWKEYIEYWDDENDFF